MLESYRNRMAAMGGYEGEARRRNSQKIMDASWMRDPATKPVYVKWCDKGLPIVDDDDVPVYAKYNVKSYHSVQGDEVSYLLQFRLEDMENRPDIKVGSYVYIPDETGAYAWWLLIHYDDRPMFRQWSVLKCLHVYRWATFKNGHRVVHECLGVPRSQSSYNSGVWLDYITASVEQQQIVIMPNNDDSCTIGYDQRFLFGDAKRHPPLAYKISKVSPSFSGDIVSFTMTQEQFSASLDNAEEMIGGYYASTIRSELPTPEETPIISDLEIIYSGSPSIRAGGGYKKLTLKSCIDGSLVELPEDAANDVKWNVSFDGNEDKLVCITDSDPYIIEGDPYTIKGNPLKVKCLNDYLLVGKSFTVTATYNNSSKSLIMEVTNL